jgi:hypothetical protein
MASSEVLYQPLIKKYRDIIMAADFCLSYGLPCSNCGGAAERHTNDQIVRTQCASCDYLLIACRKTGRVIECYAPGVREVSINANNRTKC